MFTVYKITNLINNKVYIGSSIDVERRWRDHKNIANNPNHRHYNYPLYCAFRKYGLENFYFEVIKDDFDSALDMQIYENLQIIEYDSVNHGYNQTYQTVGRDILTTNHNSKIKGQKCAKVDKDENIIEVYVSYHEAARKNFNSKTQGNYEATQIRAVCKGIQNTCLNGLYFRDLDENNCIISKPIKNYNNKTTVVAIDIDNPENIQYFNSVSEAALCIGTDRGSIHKCIAGQNRYSIVHGYIFRELDINGNIIHNNIDIDEKIQEYNRTNPLINGERHTISDWCKIYDISQSSYYKRIKKGMDVVEALTTPKRR